MASGGSSSSVLFMEDSGFAESFLGLLRDGSFSDVKFVVGSTTLESGPAIYEGHKCVWSARTSRFDRLLEGATTDEEGVSKVRINEAIDIKDFEKCLEFIYGGKSSVPRDEILDLLFAATELGVQSLREQALEQVLKTIAEDTVFGYLGLSYMIQDADILKKACLDFISRNAGRVITSKDVASLPHQAMVDIMKHPSLDCTEGALTQALLLWGYTKALSRPTSFGSVVEDCAELAGEDREKVTATLEPFFGLLKTSLYTFEDAETVLERSSVIPQPLVLEAYKGRARSSSGAAPKTRAQS